MKTIVLAFRIALAAFLPSSLLAALPDTLPYQGRITVKDLNFTGTGSFKFSIYEHATGAFTPASASAVVTNGFVTSVTVLDGGKGYSSGVTVAFNGVGNGATATATVVDGVVTGIAIVTPGSGYSTAPTVVLNEPTAPTQLWNNTFGPTDAALEEPRFAVPLEVRNGLYTVGLGDTALTVMQPLPASLAPAAGKRVFLRVWFDDGVHGFQALAPDTELHAVPFAREAANTASVGGVSLTNLARLDTANTFTSVNGLSVTGAGPNGTTPAAGATVPLSGAGTRQEFLPGYGAFRAGSVEGDQWSAANIGIHSTAFGFNTIASGRFSLASGYVNTASNTCSTAMGFMTTASGLASTAIGDSTKATGYGATALGSFAQASGNFSIAAGDHATAGGLAATALGFCSIANGSYSIASGLYAVATGNCATSMGDHTEVAGYGGTALGAWTAARGTFATALGLGTSAESYAETAIGSNMTRYTPNSATTWNTADRLFVIGNGTEDQARSDALVMLKSGNTTLNGTLRVNALDGLTITGAGPNGTAPATGATVPLSGAGTRLEFLPGYGAFRAGTVDGTQWDAANIGLHSTAFGYNTTASGPFSLAAGFLSSARSTCSTALGFVTTASGSASTALGYYTIASGGSSTALGHSSEAVGDFSFASGYSVSAESAHESVLGRFDTTYTPLSTTSWNPADRLFVIGNGTNTTARSDALIVFKNGNATLQGALTQGSDRNRKTDIVPADTAAILAGVAALPLATWKYRDETATHLGPMAQDFATAFHLGADETGIASVDADGVALAAIQELKKQLDAKDAKIAALEARLAALEAKLP